MGYMVLAILVSDLFILYAGFKIHEVINVKKSAGEIVMDEDAIYLNVFREEINEYQNGNFVILRVKRRNFSGFNE